LFVYFHHILHVAFVTNVYQRGLRLSTLSAW